MLPEPLAHLLAQLVEAISAASRMRAPFGRSGLVYAITAEGREAYIEGAHWPRMLQG